MLMPPGEAPTDAGDGLCTPRLMLRRYTPEDLEELVRLNSDPRVMRYLGGTTSPELNRTMLETRILTYYSAHPGLGVWRTLERSSGRCVGFHLLNHIQGETFIQVGYRLFFDCWGLGYATEMCRALLRYGFRQRALSSIVAITDLENRASQHVLLKSGLRAAGRRRFAHPAYAGAELAFFERGAAEWCGDFDARVAAAPSAAEAAGDA